MNSRPLASIALSLFLVAFSSTARAETSSLPAAPGRGGGLAVYLFAGHSGWNTTALDSRLGALGYSSFSQDPGSGGLGLRAWVDSCQCTGAMEFQFALASTNADDGRQLSLTAGQFMLQAGRPLVSSWSASSGSGSSATSYPVDLPRVAADGAFVHLVFGDLALAR